MKPPTPKLNRLNSVIVSLTLLAFAAFGPAAHATSAAWTGLSSSSWSGSGNWTGSPAIVPGTGDVATFTNSGNANTTLDLGSGITISNIVFDTVNAAAYTVGAGAIGSQSAMINSNGMVLVTASVVSNQLVNANLSLGTAAGANPFVISNNSTTAGLTIAGGISTAQTGTKTVTAAGAGVITVNGNIANGSGAIALVRSGTGTLILNASNNIASLTWAGGVNSGNQGAVRVTTNSALVGATITMPGQNTTFQTLELANNVSITNNITTSSRDAGSAMLRNVSDTNTFVGNLTATATGGGLTVESAAGKLTVTGTIGQSGISARGLTLQGAGIGEISSALTSGNISSVTKNSTGTWILSGNNTITAITFNQGILRLANNNAAGTTATITSAGRDRGVEVTGNVTIPATTTFALSGDGGQGGAATVLYAMRSVTGVNSINGMVRMTSGAGNPVITVDSGSTLNLNGAITNDSARTVLLGGAGTGSVNGVIKNGVGVTSLWLTNCTGIWTLTNVNTYTGETVVGQGTLALTGPGSIGSTSNIVIASGATLDVSGLASTFTLGGSQILGGNGAVKGNATDAAGAKIVPGGSLAIGTLSFSNNLTLAGGDLLNFDFSNTTNDVVVVGGNLTPNGNTLINLTSYPSSGFVAGDYTLLQVYGTLGGSAASFTLTNVPSPSRLGFSIVYDTVSTPNRVLLHVTGSGANLVWNGGLNANAWDVFTTSNWLNGVNLDRFYQSDYVTFDDTGVANSPVNLNTSVSPTTLAVNSTGNYTITGSGKITGSTGLTKSNSGTLTLATTNDYTGVTAINGGTVSVASMTNGGVASPIGAATSASANLTFNGGKLQYTGAGDSTDRGATLNAGGATLEVSSSIASLTVGGAIVGTGGGGLTKVGNGTLILGGANTYDGATAINAGLLQIGAGGATGSVGLGNVADNTALVVNRTGTLTMSNVVSGPGSLTNIGTGTLVLAVTNTYAGQTVISNGVIQVLTAKSLGATPAAYDAAHVQLGVGELEAGTSFTLNDTNTGITTANGKIGVDSGMTFIVSNTITGVSVTKSRAGTLVLGGSNSLSGTLFVDTASSTGSDGIIRITSTNALGGVPDIQIRNSQVAGSSTLQLDGSSGSMTLNQTVEWTGRNNYVPALEFLAGDNVWSPTSVTLNSGGSFYPISCDAGTLTIPTSFPTTSPSAARNFVFGGAGNILVTASIQSAGSIGLGVVKTNSGTLTLSGGQGYNGVSSFQEGIVNLDNATIGVSTTNIELAPLSGQTAVVNMTNGSVNAMRVIIAGITANNTSPGTGTLNQVGGTINSAQWFTVGSGGSSAGNIGGTGTYNLTDGTLNVQSQQMEVGNFTGSSGLVTMNGSSPSINIWNNNYLTLGANAGAGNGTFVQNAGSVTLYSDGGGTPGGTGFLFLGRATGLTGTYTYWLNGGALSVPAIASASGTSLLYLNGGTLRPSKSNPTFITNVTAINVSTNGAIVDTGSYTNVIGLPLAHDPALGGAADGGLTVQGSGELVLGGTNTYTGNTLINSGLLAVNGSITNGAVTVQGGTLGGNGVLYGPTTLSYGTIAPGTSIGVLSISNDLTLNSGTILLEATPSTNDVLAVSGTVNVAGGVTIQLSFPTPNIGTYTLIKYGSLSGFGNLTLSLATPNPRYTLTLTNDTVAKAVKVIATGVSANLTWRGDGGYNGWDNTGGYQNWTNSAQATMDYFYDGDVVLFDNTGSNTPSINLTTAVTPGSVTVNSANDYDFAGSGYITGIGGLTKSGAGTLVLEGNNDYTGATIINGGTLQVGNHNTGGTSGSIGSGAVTNNGTLVFDRTDSPTFTNNVNGTGSFADLGVSGTLTVAGNLSGDSVAKGGLGTLVLSGSNSYTGLTIITNGILFARNPAALGTGDNGTVATNGGQLYIDQNINITNESLVLGGSALRKGGGGVTIWGGPVSLAASTTIQIDGGATLNLTNTTPISGDTYNLVLTGDAGSSGLVSGNIGLGTGIFGKDGAGTWTLGGSNDFVLGSINNGTLVLANKDALGTNQNIQMNSTTGGAGLSGTRLTLSGGITIAANKTLSMPSSGAGTVRSALFGTGTGVTNVWAGSITLFGDGNVGNNLGFGVDAGSTLVLGGTVLADGSFPGKLLMRGNATGTGIVNGQVLLNASTGQIQTDDGSTWIFTAAGNTWATNIFAGSSAVKLGVNNALPTGVALMVGNGTANKLDLSGFSQQVSMMDIPGGGLIITNSSASADSTLTYSSVGTSAFGGIIADGTRKLNLTIAAGTLNLSNATTLNITKSTVSIASGGMLQLNYTGTNTVYGLVLNGASQPAGLYNSTTSGSYLGGTGNLLVQPVATNPTNITIAVSGNSLQLTWPGDHLGWTLLTNSVGLTATNAWFPYPNSATTTNVSIPLDATKTNVFFRIVYPYP